MNTIAGIPAEWKKWIQENLMGGSAPESLVQVMLEKQFDPVVSVCNVIVEAVRMSGETANIEALCARAEKEIALSLPWKQWVTENLARGCAPKTLLQTMAENRLDPAQSLLYVMSECARLSIEQTAGSGMPAHILRNETGAQAAHPLPAVGHGGPRFSSPDTFIQACDQRVHVRMRLTKPCVAVFDDVMSHQECDELIRLAASRVRRSSVVDAVTGESVIIEQRTSSGTFLGPHEDELVRRLDLRVAALMQLPVDHGEDFQILRYEPGQQYTPHHDFFEPGLSSTPRMLNMGGQRVSTLVIYLNDVDRGGETIFPQLGLSVVPKKGSAVYFEYCDLQGNLDYATLHGGAPVLEGEKWVATKWMRFRSFK